MKSLRARKEPAIAALVVAGLLAFPSDMDDTALRPHRALHAKSLPADVQPPRARFCLIGGDDSCPRPHTLRACLISTGRCPYGTQVLLITSPGQPAVSPNWSEP
jgi:hypothetical protein